MTTFPCNICHKVFFTKWELNHHHGDSHQPGITRVRAGKPGEYPCLVCHQVKKSRAELNKHIFKQHSDVEVFSKYAKTVEELVGNYQMRRLRAPYFNAMVFGQWDEHLGQLIN